MSSLRFALNLTGQLFHMSLQFVEPNTYVLLCDREGFNVGAECKFCVGPEKTGERCRCRRPLIEAFLFATILEADKENNCPLIGLYH